MARTPGASSKSTIEFRAAWDAACRSKRFDLIAKLMRWCRSRDADVSLKAISLAMQFRYSKPATQVTLDAPAQMALAWDTDADDAVLTLATRTDDAREPTQH